MHTWSSARAGFVAWLCRRAIIVGALSLAVEAVGLTAFRKAYPKQLSGGMRKRVDLVRAYANSPDVLLMDEPFAALDEQTKAEMQDAVLELWTSTRKTVVFVTHDLDEAVFLSDVVVVLSSRPGRVHATVRSTLPRPRTSETRVSDAFAAAKRKLWTTLEEARGRPIADTRKERLDNVNRRARGGRVGR